MLERLRALIEETVGNVELLSVTDLILLLQVVEAAKEYRVEVVKHVVPPPENWAELSRTSLAIDAALTAVGAA